MNKALFSTVLFTFPLLAVAQVNNLTNAISLAGDLLNRVIPVLIALALVVFFWGLVQYIRSGKAAGGKDIMIAGLVGLFIMVSVWGIIRIAQNTLGVSNQGTDIRGNIPQVPQR
jgi:hypothetical protein